MTTSYPPPQPHAERIYKCKKNTASASFWWWLASLVMCAFGLFGFVVALFGRADPIKLQLTTTLPFLCALAAFIRARSLRRAPLGVTLDDAGFTIHSQRDARHLPWQSLGWARIDAAALATGRVLRVYDTGGRRVVNLPNTLDGFDELAETVKTRIGERDPAAAGRIELSKARRTAILMVSIATLMLVIGAFALWASLDEDRADRLLADAAVPGQAEIIEHFLAPNGVTRRVEYRITTDDGRSATHNAEVEPDVWDALAGATTVEVIYVPEEPRYTRLRVGEIPNKHTLPPRIMMVAAVVEVLFCLFLYVVAILAWRGWDIDIDSKTLKPSIKRFGTGR